MNTNNFFYSDRYSAFYEQLAKNEGLKADDPLDKGGATICGIASKYYPKEYSVALSIYEKGSIEELHEYVKKFYHQVFYSPHYDDINDSSLTFRIFDFGVNAGKKQSVKVLQRLINKKFNSKLKVDGVLGGITVGKINWIHKVTYRNGQESLFYEMYEKRLKQYYKSLWNFFRFGKGWMRRLKKVFNGSPDLVAYKEIVVEPKGLEFRVI